MLRLLDGHVESSIERIAGGEFEEEDDELELLELATEEEEDVLDSVEVEDAEEIVEDETEDGDELLVDDCELEDVVMVDVELVFELF
jgi:hypothetical protein